ncbi:MAG: SGNH/GDSL hydrolase family protein [Caulobacteraceae bacterium]
MQDNRETSRHRRAYGAVLALALATAGTAPAFAASTEPVPNSMAALGDSITRGFLDCNKIADCPMESWSTGVDPAVDSQYRRILKINPAINGQRYNLAASGSKVADIQAQATAAVADGVDYLTILIGANDACAATVADMTQVSTFRAAFAQALDGISTGLPNARIFVASIPDLYRLWQLASPIPQARSVWKLASICQSMLADPLSMKPADMARRQAVLQRVIDYNTQLGAECALHAHCKFDHNTVFNHTFSLSDIGTIDYFHPSIPGQAALAKGTWRAGFGW